MMDITLKVCCRTRRMRLACGLMRVLSVAKYCLPRHWTETLARKVICQIAIIELRIGEGRWQRCKIKPEEIAFA